MSRRQSIPNGYPSRPGTRILPPSYQPQPIPMITHNNSFKNNRVAPPPPSQPFEPPSSRMSSNPHAQTSYRQPRINSNYPQQSYYPQNNHPGYPPDDQPAENLEPTSCFSKPLCLGLTRLSGGILFGTMIFLSLASIGGLIASIVLYIQDSITDPQWKILGMVVCAIMLLTVLVTLCIFIYCYKKGRIANNNNDNNKTNSSIPPYHHDNDFRHPYHHNRSPVPYGRMENASSIYNDEDIVPVQDKLTNTEKTISSLRPRDIHRGVWHGQNAYGGLSQRPIEPPRVAHRVIQALPSEIDQTHSKQYDPVVDSVPQTIIRLPDNRREHVKEKHPRRFIERQPQYDVVEEVISSPSRRETEEHVEIVGLSKKGRHKQRFNKVSVRHVRQVEEPRHVDNDYNTDHFYQ